jgi:hypothetical protein
MKKSHSDRLRALRDRFNIRGLYELSFEEKLSVVREIIGTYVFRRRELHHVRNQISKLKARHPNLTDSQKVALAELDEKFIRREQLVLSRIETAEAKKKTNGSTKAAPPAPGDDLLKLWS